MDMDNAHKFGFVALLGPPNAGKSTLLNRLLGEKVAIVTPKPQTTRNAIRGILTREDAQVVFVDTPGVHQVGGPLNRLLLTAAWNAAASADLWAILLDAAAYVKKPELLDRAMAPLEQGSASYKGPLLILLNKVDAVSDKTRLLPLMERVSRIWPENEMFPLSAAKGQGVDEFLEKAVSLLPQGPAMFPPDQLCDAPVRFMAAEIIREKLFLALRQEAPYSVAVEIEQWSEEAKTTRIAALITVARDSHKGMVIGKGGALLKEIGRSARLDIQELTGRKVFLEIWVKVRKNWTEDLGFLRALGLGE